ncbi:hypothetical protein ACHQM5_005170 [Ranunculus cassubicifolius]
MDGKDEEVTKKKKCQVIQQLPEDIISEILLRIPAEILNCMRLVCRTWSDLILSQHFVNAHLLRLSPGLLILERENESDKFKSHFMDVENGQVIKQDLSFTCPQQVLLGICNGLLFIGNADAHLGFHDLCVVNLATKKSISLPSQSYPTSSTSFCLYSVSATKKSIGLPAHPHSTSSTTPFVKYKAGSVTCGITFVPSTNEYKASINLFRESLGTGEVSRLCESRILTLGTNTWRELFFPLEGFGRIHMQFGSSISVGGVLHFRVISPDSKGLDHLTSLDLASEKLEKTYLPDDLQVPNHPTRYMFESGGFLSLVDREFNTGKWDIWELKDFYSKDWVKTYTFFIERFWGDGCLFRPTLSLKNGKLIVFMHSSLSQDPMCLYAYDIENQELKLLGNVETNRLNQYSAHVNSLASWGRQ